MARPSNSEERRQQIIDGLLSVMAERGYERATIAEVAKAARLTPGLVHYHFESKQEVLLALIDHLARTLEARLEKRLAEAGDRPLARVEAFIDAHLALGPDADPKAVASWVAVSAEAVRSDEARTAYRRIVTRSLGVLTGLVKEALPSGARNAGPLAVALFASIQGQFVLSAAAPELIAPGSAAASVKQVARGLIAVPSNRGGRS